MIMSMKTLTSVFIGFALSIVAGCNLSKPMPVAVAIESPIPYIRISQVATATPLPAVNGSSARDLRPIPTLTAPPSTATAQPTISPYACGVENVGEHLQHVVTATLDYEAKALEVAQSVYFRNETQVALNDLVFDIQANIWPGAFSLSNLTLLGKAAGFSLDRNRLIVALPALLNPGCSVTVDLQFSLAVPRIGTGLNSFKGFFGYGERQINLGHWLPTVAPHLNNEWAIHDPSQIGEQVVLEQADWDVTFNVDNAPPDLVLAAPGTGEKLTDSRWHHVHHSARDFALSLSEQFQMSQAHTESGVIVELYHYPDAQRIVTEGVVNGAAHTLSEAVRSMEQYESLFGSYPYERMVIIQGDFPDGMEFSGFVFVSTAWFYGFEGGADNFLTVITVHEVAHQWWYARVGNDAALTPWLDEALTTYSEYVYFEEFYPELKDWWWSFRVGWYNPQGEVDSNVYEFETVRDYINAVYLRGAQLLHNLREDLGTDEFFNLLAAYAQAADGEIISSDMFWSLLTPQQWEATATTRAEFLGQPVIHVEVP